MNRIGLNAGHFSDPEILCWARGVVEEARAQADSISGTLLDALTEALEDPAHFASQSGPFLLRALATAYFRTIEGGSARTLRLEAQGFARRLGPIRDAARPSLPTPIPIRRGDGEDERRHLERRFPNIGLAVEELGLLASENSILCQSPYLMAYARSLQRRLDEIERMGSPRTLEIHRQLYWIEKRLKIISHFCELEDEHELAQERELLIREIHALPVRDRDELGKLFEHLMGVAETSSYTARTREAMAEAKVRLLDFEKPYPRTPTTAEAAQATARRHGIVGTIESYADVICRIISSGRPIEALAGVAEMELPPEIAGAVLLTASYNYRFGTAAIPGFNEFYLSQVYRNFSGRPMASVGRDERALMMTPGYIERLSEIGRTGIALVHVELGGGEVPYGLRLANEIPEARVISVDPQVLPTRWDMLGLDHAPQNFGQLAGRAEALAPFSAAAPFADGAYMVAPDAHEIMPMLLSALLFVKPGSGIFIYLKPADPYPKDFLARNDLAHELYTLPPGDPRRPPSLVLRPDYPMRVLRVNMGPKGGDRRREPRPSQGRVIILPLPMGLGDSGGNGTSAYGGLPLAAASAAPSIPPTPAMLGAINCLPLIPLVVGSTL